MGPWAEAFLKGVRHVEVSDTSAVTHLRVEPSLISARVDGREVTLSAQPISAGIWAAIDASVTPDRQSEHLLQLLDHTWDEPLVPAEIVRVGSPEDVAAVVAAVAERIEREPATLLRFRGYGAASAGEGDELWQGGALPELPPPARRPPDSVPKRFGASGITTADGDLVEVLVRAYGTFADD